MSITVDKNVPIPPVQRPGVGRPAKYPFRQMEIGDSFFVERSTRFMARAVFYWEKKCGGKFSARTVIENGVKGCRVWRVA